MTVSIQTMPRPGIAVVIPAAGRSSRMGDPENHKLLARFDGQPLIRRVVTEAVKSNAVPVVVVTGFLQAEIGEALAGLPVHLVHNASHAEGMGTSLATGFNVPEIAVSDGALVMLADMPAITADHLNRLIAIFQATGGASVIRAVAEGVPGHPVLLPSALYPALRGLGGDAGARRIIERSGLPVIPVEIGAAALLDVDTPDDLARRGGRLS